MPTRSIRLLNFSFLLLLAACNRNPEPAPPAAGPPPIPSIDFELLRAYPHDTNAFTEGLFVHEGKLYESTGATREISQTRSLFGIVDLATGKIETKAELDSDRYFGEGIALLNGKIYQLTYTTRVGFIYDAKSFKRLGEFTLPGKEGWGLTTDGTNLVLSDGTDVLTWLDPNTLKTLRTVKVTENGYAKDRLNELEYIRGFLYANVWTTHTIVKIDPSTGHIVATLDLSALANEARNAYPGTMETNGIAWDSTTNTVYVTGKMWPKLYAIRIAN
jgi:glutamine cyclotransferase